MKTESTFNHGCLVMLLLVGGEKKQKSKKEKKKRRKSDGHKFSVNELVWLQRKKCYKIARSFSFIFYPTKHIDIHKRSDRFSNSCEMDKRIRRLEMRKCSFVGELDSTVRRGREENT